MIAREFASFVLFIARLLFPQRSSAPAAAEVATWRIGQGIIRTDTATPEWWLKLAAGNALEKVYPGGGGGGVTGAPRAIVFVDPSGTGANTDPDLVVRPAALGNYGRPEIWDHRPRNPPDAGPVIRQGASSADGDAFDSPGDGIVVYGPAPNGTQDNVNFAFGRMKSNRFAIRFCQGGVDIGDAWHVDTTEQYFKNNAGTRTWEVNRATGNETTQGTLNLGQFTFGTLPVGTEGARCWCSNGRKLFEGPGLGTGVPVYFSQGSWRVYSTDLPVSI